MEARCREVNNLWSVEDVILYCVFLVSVIVLCCVVLCEYRVRVLKQVKPRNIVKMQDESGIDVTGEDSFEEPSTQGPTLSEILRVMKKFQITLLPNLRRNFQTTPLN